MVKQAVQVLIRTRPTDNFASQNFKIDPQTGVSVRSPFPLLTYPLL